ncbi:MAG: hypothetical protein FWC19_02100 [Treponema sp.]|nr:hypothetical protein [Treponema sp.]
MIFRRSLTILILLFFNFINLCAFEYSNGNIKLYINEKTGNFSLYYLDNPDTLSYVPLFNAAEPRASYLSVSLDGRVYKLGQSNTFRTRLESESENPVVTYESMNLTITKSFTPVKTSSSQEVNGVKIAITITNTGGKTVSAGLRMLLDTHLGEGKNDNHFVTDRQTITRETLLDGTSGELFWVSKNQNFSLMGSLIDPLNGNAKAPDNVHFANWRRLYNVPWTLSYVSNRSMDNRPYSIQDSAVCYFYNPAQLDAGESFVYAIILSTEDYQGYGLASSDGREVQAYAGTDEFTYTLTTSDSNDDLKMMLMLQETLKKFIAGEIYLDAQDLDEIERTINGLR